LSSQKEPSLSVGLSVSHQRVLTLDDALEEECEQEELDYPTTQKEEI